MNKKWVAGIAPGRRAVLKAGAMVLALGPLQLARGAELLGVRVWPAEEYTRVTLESDVPLRATHQLVPYPDRLVVDIEGLELNPALRQLIGKVAADDPYIDAVRIGQNRPGVVRVVFDLKDQIVPQVFTLSPIGGYRHRLVFDLYPVNPPDPLLRLVRDTESKQRRLNLATTAPPSAEMDDPIAELARGASAAEILARTPPPPANSSRASRPAEILAGKGAAASTGVTGPAPRFRRLLTVALDPGHGGEDPGAIGAAGSMEKHVVLSIAKRLQALIDAQPNMRAMLTRDGDYFVPLHVRVQKARRVQADLFVSIHADAFISPQARGASVFALSEGGASSTAARWLANKENSADLVGGVNVRAHDRDTMRVLLDLSTTAQIRDSLKVGHAVLKEIGSFARLHKPRVEQAGFAVLKAPDIPSILIETAFISNPEEEARLNDDAYQNQIAEAIMRGIRGYFARNPPLSKNSAV